MLMNQFLQPKSVLKTPLPSIWDGGVGSREVGPEQLSSAQKSDQGSPNGLRLLGGPCRTMTAEVAILNKSAVALATDSAITISVGEQHEKIYDTGDKLFELSNKNPIGIMIYNGVEFLGVPLQTIIKSYRDACPSFTHVEKCADHFLNHLLQISQSTDQQIVDANASSIIASFLKSIAEEFRNSFFEMAMANKNFELPDDKLAAVLDEKIKRYEGQLDRHAPAKFVGSKKSLAIKQSDLDIIEKFIEHFFGPATDDQKTRLFKLCQKFLLSDRFSRGRTGLIFAGFGSKETFPSLFAYEIDGIVSGCLRYKETEKCDIDRKGPKARVIPFAQRRMVERFLYGVDGDIERTVQKYCRESLSNLNDAVLGQIEFPDEATKVELARRLKNAEASFLLGLQKKTFDVIKSAYGSDIEDMVEFMPKAEIAKMAEALIELTSIKHRVSRGMETVGGPVDVAVISRSEGLV